MFFSKLYNLAVRRVFSQVADPLVEYRAGRFTMKLPLSHELPFHQEMHEHYGFNIVRIAAQAGLEYPDLKFIDIGANVGDTVLAVRNSLACPILAIEGDPRFFSILRHNCAQVKDVAVHRALVGEKDQKIAGRLSPGKGSAHILNTPGPGAMDTVTLETVLTAHPGFRDSKILKIDTDGFELKIIRGARPWIERAQPIIFFEFDPACMRRQNDDPRAIFVELKAMGYGALLVYYNTGEYMCSAALDNARLIEDIHEYFCGRKSRVYADICAFHHQDMGLFDNIRSSEINHFREARYER